MSYFYIFTLLCLTEGGGEGQIANFGKKNPEVYSIIIKEWLKNNPSILRNLDNFAPGAFYSPPSPLPPTICHKRVTAITGHEVLYEKFCNNSSY